MARSINPAPQFSPGGKMYYYKSKTNSALPTFADPLFAPASINPNPVPLDAAGRLPNVFFEGSAKQVLFDSNGNQVWERDPVGGENITGNFSAWDPNIIYSSNNIVEASDSQFYISFADANQGNDPTTSNNKWSVIKFVKTWNALFSYAIGDVVSAADGTLWRSLVTPNLGNSPTTDAGLNWAPAIDASKTVEIIKLESRTSTVSIKIGGGALEPFLDNEFHDGGTYTLPLASSVLVGQFLDISLPDRYSAQTPTVLAAGADTITDVSSVDTSILFDAGGTSLRLTSDGVSNWDL